MLKIRSIKWKAKCSRHPRFNPESDGSAAIRGNCPRCLQLQEILDTHRRTIHLMRSFGPPLPPKSKRPHADLDRQQLLFAEADREEPRGRVDSTPIPRLDRGALS